MKVFVLGNGGVGKSYLCNRLLPEAQQLEPKTIVSTHGIQVRTFQLDVATCDRPADLNLWDFGGQDIYHGSHALFLQRRAIFLLLWTPDHEQGSWDEAGVIMRHQPLSYWLTYIRNLAGTDAPILVVQSQCDRRDQCHRQPPAELPSDVPFLRTCAVSALTSYGWDEFQGLLRGATTELFSQRRPPRIGKGRIDVRRRVRQLALTQRTMTTADFLTLPDCRSWGFEAQK